MSQQETTPDPGRSREPQPASADEVEESAGTVERQQAHNRPLDDDAGINPGRQQGSGSGPEHDADEPPEGPR
jgi:hypothetical protein